MKKTNKSSWRIWTDQVNQTMFVVVAGSKEEAIKKAKKEWKENFGHPIVNYVEEEKL